MDQFFDHILINFFILFFQMNFVIEKIFNVSRNAEITTLLMLVALVMLFKYFIDTFCRDSRLMKFAATLPGPPALPLIGNGYEFFINGTRKFQ